MKNKLWFLPVAFVILMASCEKEKVKTIKTTFEELSLGEEGYYNGSDGSGGFTSKNIFFPNFYYSEYAFWNGFAYSNHTDKTTRGYSNQYSSITGSGAGGSEKYAVLYSSGSDTIELIDPSKITNISFCNSTYTYYSILEGDDFATIFGGSDGNSEDFFNLIVKGLDENKQTLIEGTIKLADYTYDNNELDYVGNQWTDVDLSEAGYLKYLVFSFESSDVNEYGMVTPAYVCIDNVFYEVQD